MNELKLLSPNQIALERSIYVCTIGRAGIAAAHEKREGDLKTPTGNLALRCCYYRPDRMATPKTALPTIALTPMDGWCDDPAHALYNQPVKLPFDGHHEKLWREDSLYDLIIPLGHNDGFDVQGNPTGIIKGFGSAIFMHIMRDDGTGTEGCVALKRYDLLEILGAISSNAIITIGQTKSL